jgi:hypothetical protein
MRKKLFFVLTLVAISLAAILPEGEPFPPTDIIRPQATSIQIGQWPPPECDIADPCRG